MSKAAEFVDRADCVTRAVMAALLVISAGCYAPLRSPGIPASQLPDQFRMPCRTARAPLILTSLTTPPPSSYRLGPGDTLDITIPRLEPNVNPQIVRLQVMPDGSVGLPKVGFVQVGGMDVLQAQDAIAHAYWNGGLVGPYVNVLLVERATVSVLVLGDVTQPGTYLLPRYENDVGHALAAAGGLGEMAADYVEVHRRQPPSGGPVDSPRDVPTGHPEPLPPPTEPLDTGDGPMSMLIIPLYGSGPGCLRPQDVLLQPGDVVRVPRRVDQVFYVVGELSQTNRTRFTIGDRERELGSGFLLPHNREIDVIEAVAMAGYIDPIDSPTTVTVHRKVPEGGGLLIRVDLILARVNPRENVLIQPGDVIYLNPDAPWWLRRTFDRLIPTLVDRSFDL